MSVRARDYPLPSRTSSLHLSLGKSNAVVLTPPTQDPGDQFSSPAESSKIALGHLKECPACGTGSNLHDADQFPFLRPEFFGLVYDFFFITGASEGLMRFLKISGGEGMRSVPGLVELRRHEL